MLGKNALVVDDSRTARMVLKRHLNQIDIIVETANDGNHALELLRDHRPDIIFLDHIMPGMDGFEVLQLLKENQSTRAIPVVMYTSQAAPQYTSEAKSLGAIGVISKEVTNEQLMQLLDRAELYQLEAVNADKYDEAEKTDSNHNTEPAGRTSSPDSVGNKQPAEPGTEQVGAAHEVTDFTGNQPLKLQQADAGQRLAALPPFTLRRWLAAAVLAVVVLAQGYGILQDRAQQHIIADLRDQVLQQERQLLETQEKMVAEQRQQTEITWRQVQFVIDVLVDQLEEG
jgi:CheY-like chemotaxis protein